MSYSPNVFVKINSEFSINLVCLWVISSKYLIGYKDCETIFEKQSKSKAAKVKMIFFQKINPNFKIHTAFVLTEIQIWIDFHALQ